MGGTPPLREAPVPARLAGALMRGPLVEATPDAILIRVPMVGRFLARGAGPALFEREPGASDADLSCFRDGPVAAAAALLRGQLAFRAACVAIRGRAVALCGASTAGKSAVAAALAQRGHTVLADAVTVIAFGQDAAPTVIPCAPNPVLWPDSVRELGLERAPARPVRPALAARAYELGPAPVAAPLVAVAILRVRAAELEPMLEPLHGAAKVEAMTEASWHLRLVDPLEWGAARLTALSRVAAAARFADVSRPRHGASPALVAELVEELAA